MLDKIVRGGIIKSFKLKFLKHEYTSPDSKVTDLES